MIYLTERSEILTGASVPLVENSEKNQNVASNDF